MVVDLHTIQILWPEVILLLLSAWIYVGGAFRSHRLGWTAFALLVYVAAAGVMAWREVPYWSDPGATLFYSGPVVVDYLGYVARWLSLVFGALMTLLLARSAPRRLTSEAIATLMVLVVGMMVVSRANDLVLLLLGLELISIPTYVLLYLGRRERGTSEATVKYFFLSLLASAMMLYGISFLYGLSGSTRLDVAAEAEVLVGSQTLASVALVLILAGLGFKLAAVPFHFYAPDVYQGATNANAALLSIAPKAAGIIAFVRLLVIGLPQASLLAWQMVLVLAMVTMTLGNVCAIRQKNFRRLMAYSSIAHAGYMLIGLSAGLAGAGSVDEQVGLSATFLYIALYGFASLGAFAVAASLSGESGELNTVESLSGLGRVQPLAAAVLAVCMFSLAGIPPLAGFWGKLTLFTSALHAASHSAVPQAEAWFTLVAIVGALNAAIAATYYLRVVGTLYFRPASSRSHPSLGMGGNVVVLVCGLSVVILGALPRTAMEAARLSAAGLRAPRAEATIAATESENAIELVNRQP